ncbi:MAG: Asp-tRNA(Asn)/Glu-tRNA(Gln) amidotransferase subunit GatB [Candidatus Omnitrophica bacterium]|nr:Asp-tRNA(Asn)/Glu-tRNA(Gln) amidotransferase subunit GatB [Candidatus Omnitrophota bacterium]
MTYESVIGLEVHLQLKTKTKLFCGCRAAFGAPPNSQTCPVCLGLPGVLPVFNEQALEWGLRVAAALDCAVTQTMKFDRKQYFYPDLPKNYQISQYDLPLAQRGHLDIQAGEGTKRINIRRVHLEEDAGKLLHEARQTETCVDFNRAGIPLLEIVSEPDLRTSDDAYQYLVELKALLQYLDVSTCNMEEGSLRCDTNVSLRRPGEAALGSKVEIKNLNSFRAVKLALEHEAQRQAGVLDAGGSIPQETRLWNAKTQITEAMRSKEEAADYRYFPEPDLVPFTMAPELVERVRRELPELPAQRRARLASAHGLSAYDAGVLTQERALADFFEAALAVYAKPKPLANWLMGDLLAYLNVNGLALDQVKVRPAWLAHLVQLIDAGTISGKMAKELFLRMMEEGADPAALAAQQGLQQIVDPAALERVADEVIQANPKSVDDYAKGKANALMYLVGQGMKRTQGKANPQQLSNVLSRKLAQAAASGRGGAAS